MPVEGIIKVVLSAPQRLLRAGIHSLLDGESGVEVCGQAEEVDGALREVRDHCPQIILFNCHDSSESARLLANLRKACPDTAALALVPNGNAAQVRQLMRRGARGVVSLEESDRMMMTALRLVARGDGYVNPTLAAKVAALGDSDFPHGITEREAEVLALIALGYTNAEVAEELYLSERTVDTHRANILRKLDTRGRRELVAKALEMELI